MLMLSKNNNGGIWIYATAADLVQRSVHSKVTCPRFDSLLKQWQETNIKTYSIIVLVCCVYIKWRDQKKTGQKPVEYPCIPGNALKSMLSLSSQATDTPEDRNNPVLLYNKVPLETLNNNFTLDFDTRVKKIYKKKRKKKCYLPFIPYNKYLCSFPIICIIWSLMNSIIFLILI